MDGGHFFRGKRILGDHKTWRGLLAGLALIEYAEHPLLPGFLMGLGTGVGDAVKSFCKRRIDIAPGASWPVFDQLDFFAGAYAFASVAYVAPLVPTLACLPIVLAGSVAVTPIGWALGLKEAWI